MPSLEFIMLLLYSDKHHWQSIIVKYIELVNQYLLRNTDENHFAYVLNGLTKK